MSLMETATIASKEVEQAAGISKVTLTRWCQKGYVSPWQTRAVGSGARRLFSPEERDRVVEIADVLRRAITFLQSHGLDGHARALDHKGEMLS